MIDWIKDNYIEIIGALLALLYLLLEIRQKWTMWIVSFISSSFYVYIFFHSKLYAEMGLNIYYVAMAVYGLYCWKFVKTDNQQELGITCASVKLKWLSGIATLFLFGIIAFILVSMTDSGVPYPDALIASLSIVATWMLAKKIIEHWYLWIFANFFSVGLYLYQELYATAILFVIYGSMSVVGLIKWRETMNNMKHGTDPNYPKL